MEDQNSYTRLKSRLEDIVVQVRSKDISLEKSLDLYEEALRIGGRCVEQIDRTDFTDLEFMAAEQVQEEAQAQTREQASASGQEQESLPGQSKVMAPLQSQTEAPAMPQDSPGGYKQTEESQLSDD